MNVVRWSLGILITIVVSTACCVVALLPPWGRWGFFGMRAWAILLARAAGLRLRIEGRQHVLRGPFVVVANHSSMLDIPTLAAAIPAPFRFVSRPFFFRIPILGWAMYMAGNISLDPRKPREAATVLRSFESRFRRGVGVLLFPEGTRTRDGQVHAYKRGPFLTAIRHGVPVVPVALSGLFRAFPKGTWTLLPGEIRVLIGEPIPTRGLAEEDARALAQRVEDWTRANVEVSAR